MRFDHPVFQGPRRVDTTTTIKTDPYTNKQIHAWRVQRDLKKPGLVATRRRFVASPDAEILAGGINMKGDRGTPLLREGNLFLWGFSGSPADMTEAGKAALANALVYMKDFGGQTPLRRVGVRDRTRWRGVLDSPYVKPSRLPTYFGPELVAQHGADKDAYRAACERSEKYLFVPRGTATWSIDRDAEALGHATNSLDLLRAALRAGDERGQRVLARYWPEDDLVMARPRTVAELDAVADQLVFSDAHGYRWLSKPPVAAAVDWEVQDALDALALPEPSEEAPAIFGARVVGTYNNKGLAYESRLGLATIAVRADVLEDWHLTLIAPDPGTPVVSIEVELADGMRWHEPKWNVQGDQRTDAGTTLGYGRLTWTRDVWLRGGVGTHTVRGKITFQVCDEERCLPPIEVPFEAMVKVR